MSFDYDAVIIGGAFSGAATALMIKRQQPAARLLIIEKTAEFDRKVGESTTEVSSCYMTRILGLTNYLGHHHLAKQGLRLWFSNRPDQQFDDCVEIGAHYQTRLPTFQVDRSRLDQHMLENACDAGCALLRPAKVMRFELNGSSGQSVTVQAEGGERTRFDFGAETRPLPAEHRTSDQCGVGAIHGREGLGQLRLAPALP